jgi:undecaprenyl-phosphate 4-deoxy-4-formamido-L-arabinose transferase
MVHAPAIAQTAAVPAADEGTRPEVSVVVTIFDEERTLPALLDQLRGALDAWARPWEVVFVDDGSRDGSREALRAAHAADPRFRIVLLKRNFGQHPAMAAGMAAARAPIVVTMDGDLQNDPADIPKLVAAIEDEGVEVASGRRAQRADALMSRKLPSRAINGMLRRLTKVEISDYGCAFNAYRRSAFEPVLHAIGRQKFTKALVLSTGASVAEVELRHQARDGQRSSYSTLRLVRLALHVLTGFFPQPIQWAGVLLGLVCSTVSLAVAIYGVVFWIVEANFPGLTFLASLVVGVLAVQGFILALLGEYVMRIQRDVERRPLYVIDEVLE